MLLIYIIHLLQLILLFFFLFTYNCYNNKKFFVKLWLILLDKRHEDFLFHDGSHVIYNSSKNVKDEIFWQETTKFKKKMEEMND